MTDAMLDAAAAALGPLASEVVFVGGATVGVWVTDAAAPPPRPTLDVDVVVEVTSRGHFSDFEDRLRDQGFAEDQDSGVICRWQHLASPLILDVMPSDPAILGFASRWYTMVARGRHPWGAAGRRSEPGTGRDRRSPKDPGDRRG